MAQLESAEQLDLERRHVRVPPARRTARCAHRSRRASEWRASRRSLYDELPRVRGGGVHVATSRSRRGERRSSDRRHVGLTLPRRVKQEAIAAAGALDWSVGDWVLAIAAEHGPALRAALGETAIAKRPAVEDAAFTALYLTPDERDELDDQAVACGLNRSAFVTAVARLALGEEVAAVVEPLRVAAAGGPDPH